MKKVLITKITLYSGAGLLLIGAQWQKAQPQSVTAGLVFLVGTVCLLVGGVLDGIHLYKSKKAGAAGA